MASSRSRTTTAAGVLAVVVTLPFLLMAARNLLLLGDARTAAVDRGAVALGIPLQSYGAVMQFTTVVLTGLSLLAILLGVNILRRQGWARDAAMFVFGLFALALPISLSGLTADPPARGAWLGAAVGTVNIAIVVLLLRRSTADDFELAERDRADRRRARADARSSA